MGEISAIGLKHLDLSIGIPNHTLGYKLAYFQDVRVFWTVNRKVHGVSEGPQRYEA